MLPLPDDLELPAWATATLRAHALPVFALAPAGTDVRPVLQGVGHRGTPAQPFLSIVTLAYGEDDSRSAHVSTLYPRSLDPDREIDVDRERNMAFLTASSGLAVRSLEVPEGRGDLFSPEIMHARQDALPPWEPEPVTIDGVLLEARIQRYEQHSVVVLTDLPDVEAVIVHEHARREPSALVRLATPAAPTAPSLANRST